jgi:hypothetical protein
VPVCAGICGGSCCHGQAHGDSVMWSTNDVCPAMGWGSPVCMGYICLVNTHFWLSCWCLLSFSHFVSFKSSLHSPSLPTFQAEILAINRKSK